MTVSAHPPVTHDAPPSVAVADTHASTEAAHGEGGGGLPQFEFQHWFGQIVYLIILFALLYWLMAKVFVPRLRGVIDQRAATIADAVQTARQVQAEAAGQAEAAKAEVEAARASSRSMAAAAKARVTEQANARAAEEEAVVNARIAEAETAIGKTRDAAMTNVGSIASDTAAAIVERLTGKAPTAAEASAAVKGAA
ncbi:F0F1 ATP synthase subunit B family protein [Brevundimonas sp.]|uniref:F0F1 ATP synthase subunit B family protein n=1 Tax=Brevundimonas sp. TaxID=1871086 RepID=UPI003F72710F